MCSSDFFLGLLALLFPPLPVWVKCGICSADSLLNILLCMLGYVPGLLHAWYIIAKYPEPAEYYGNYDSEGGRVAYVRINQEEGAPAGGHGGRRVQQGGRQPKPQPAPHANMNYGSAAGSSSSAPPPPPVHDYNGGEGSSEDMPPPPSYAEVVGDHKIQDRS
ncbi:hypothetical protein VMCG_04955 [Cytospora schulzeri]|uniref:Stress response RCI peptide n=1 Tax=Cytospora schulzeri TaxID=448051 RepID=A0A423WME7_9PEZI|nr:hypothetical protein VMCG_04955 [Valsa malicola]